MAICCFGCYIDIVAGGRMKRDRREQIAWSYADAAQPMHLASDGWLLALTLHGDRPDLRLLRLADSLAMTLHFLSVVIDGVDCGGWWWDR